jgi:NAD+ kinase
MAKRAGVGAIGMLVHPQNPAAQETAARIRERLAADAIPCWEESTRATDTDISETHLAATRLLLVLGGDGSLMRAAQLTAPRDIPVVAVSLGRLGFLAELTPENAVDLLPQFLAGNYWLDRRLMLEVTVARADGTSTTVLAANDAVVTNPKPSRVLDVTCAVDDAPVTTFVADAFIVSTPTGSTAYNLAAHGPIVAPWTQTMILTPVAPHLSSIDSLIISSDARVTLVASSREGAVLTSDGQIDVPLASGDVVHICASRHTLALARVNPRNHFYATLVSRLIRREQWGSNAPSGS